MIDQTLDVGNFCRRFLWANRCEPERRVDKQCVALCCVAMGWDAMEWDAIGGRVVRQILLGKCCKYNFTVGLSEVGSFFSRVSALLLCPLQA